MRFALSIALLMMSLVGIHLLQDLPANPPAQSVLLVGGYEFLYGLAAFLIGVGPGIALQRRLRIPIWPLLILGILSLIPPAVAGIRQQRPDVALTLPPGRPPMCKVELLGIDGADLDDIHRLAEKGLLPNFSRILAEGVSGPLKTISPHSPIVWTSIATGQKPSVHGIKGYTSIYLKGSTIVLPEDPWDILGKGLDAVIPYRHETAVGSNARQVRAIWEIASDYGMNPVFLNWWATWPSDAIQGTLISNQAIPWTSFSEDDIQAATTRPHITTPENLAPEVAEITRAYVAKTGAQYLLRNAFSKEGSKFFVARDELVWQLRARYKTAQTQLTAPYMQEVDTSSHAWSSVVYGANINKKRTKKISEAEATTLWDELVGAAYQHMDQRVGEVLEGLGADGCLVIVSDHGWAYDGTSHFQKPDGTFIAYGAPFAKGKQIKKAHVYDILPTLATLLGIPVSAELPGKVLSDAFLQKPDIQTIPSYGPRTAQISVPVEDDEGHIERLKSLGYLQ